MTVAVWHVHDKMVFVHVVLSSFKAVLRKVMSSAESFNIHTSNDANLYL